MTAEYVLEKDAAYLNSLFDLSTKSRTATEIYTAQKADFELNQEDIVNKRYERNFLDFSYFQNGNEVKISIGTAETKEVSDPLKYVVHQTLINKATQEETKSSLDLDEGNLSKFIRMVAQHNPDYIENFDRQVKDNQLAHSLTSVVYGLVGRPDEKINLNEKLLADVNLCESARNEVLEKLSKKKVQNISVFVDPEECEKSLANALPLGTVDISRITIGIDKRDSKYFLDQVSSFDKPVNNLSGKAKIELFSYLDESNDKTYYVCKETTEVCGKKQQFYSRFDSIESMQMFVRPAVAGRSDIALNTFDRLIAKIQMQTLNDLDLVGRFKKVGLENSTLNTIIESQSTGTEFTTKKQAEALIENKEILTESTDQSVKQIAEEFKPSETSTEAVKTVDAVKVNDDDQSIEMDLHYPPSFSEQGLKLENGFYTPDDNVKPAKSLTEKGDHESTILVQTKGDNNKFELLFRESKLKNIVGCNSPADDSKLREKFHLGNEDCLYRVTKNFMCKNLNLFKEKTLGFFKNKVDLLFKREMSESDKIKFAGVSQSEYEATSAKEKLQKKQSESETRTPPRM